MSYLYLPRVKTRARPDLFPWLLFLYVAFSLLVIFHWPLVLHNIPEDYNYAQVITLGGFDRSSTREAVLITLCAVAIHSLWSRPKDVRLRMGGTMGWFLLAFMAWALFSAAWAQDFSLTVKRLVSFIIICLFATAVARRLTLREVLLWTFFTMTVFLLIALSSEIANGMFHPGRPGYRFSGIQHPNGEGAECALLAFSGLVAGNIEKQRRWLYVSGGLVGTFFLILTASRTTLAAAALAFAVYSITVSRKNTKAMILPCVGILFSLLLLLTVAGAFEGLEQRLFPGRDDGGGVESFSGRSSVWKDLVPYIQERPLQGYGYGGFWTPSVQTVIADKEGWEVPDGHSTYVDYVLTLGVVGLILNALCLVTGLGRAFSSFRRTRDPHFAFLAGILSLCVVDGFLESAPGEVSPLACFTVVALIRLAFVPLRQTADADSEAAVWKKRPVSHGASTLVHSPYGD